MDKINNALIKFQKRLLLRLGERLLNCTGNLSENIQYRARPTEERNKQSD